MAADLASMLIDGDGAAPDDDSNEPQPGRDQDQQQWQPGYAAGYDSSR